MTLIPSTLPGKWITLVPFSEMHAVALYKHAAPISELFFYLIPTYPICFQSADHIAAFYKAKTESGNIVFTVMMHCEEQMVPVGNFLLIPEVVNKSFEIGGVWLGECARKSPISLECVYLLLNYCFESLHAIRVMWKADKRNIPSNKLALKTGAVFEGIFRSHIIMRDGYRRDSCMYSWIEDEFDNTKKIIHERLYVGAV